MIKKNLIVKIMLLENNFDLDQKKIFDHDRKYFFDQKNNLDRK